MLLDQRDALASLKMGELMRALDAIKTKSLDLAPPRWPKDPVEMDQLLDSAAKIAGAQLPKVLARRDEAIRRRARSKMKSARFPLSASRRARAVLRSKTALSG